MTTILFVCVHNAGRSQLAAGLAAASADSDVTVISAGTDPDAAVSATGLDSLAEVGIDGIRPLRNHINDMITDLLERERAVP